MSLQAESTESSPRRGNRSWLIHLLALAVLVALGALPAFGQDAGSDSASEDDSEQVAVADDDDSPQEDVDGDDEDDDDEGDEDEEEDEEEESPDGLTDEEREFLKQARHKLSEEDKDHWDALARKRLEHFKKIRQRKIEERQARKRRAKDDKAEAAALARGPKPDKTKPTPKGRGKRATPKKPKAKQPAQRANPPPEQETDLKDEPKEDATAPDKVSLLPEDNFEKPWHERMFYIGMQERPYDELVIAFARKAGFTEVLNVPLRYSEDPEGTISYTTPEPLDFFSTLHEINDRLYFEISPPLYLFLNRSQEDPEKARLELNVFKELRKRIPSERLFTSLEAVRSAGLRGSDIVRVFFKPENAGAMKIFDQLVSTMLDDHTLAVLDAKTSQIDFTGRMDMLDKMLDYMGRFEGMAAGTNIERVPVIHLDASEALEKLAALVENVVQTFESSGKKRKSTRKGRKSDGLTPESEKVVVIADDAHSSLLVSGVPYKIQEVKDKLEIIDIPLPETVDVPLPPIVIRLKHAQAEEAAEILEKVMNDKKAPRVSGRGRKPKRKKGTSERTDSIDHLQIIAETRSNSLILQGREELVEYAKDFIKEFVDIPAGTSSFRHLAVKHGDPDEIAGIVKELLTTKGKAPKGTKPFKITATTDAVWLTGEPADMAQAEEIIKKLDVADGERVTTYMVELQKAEPSFAIEILQSILDSKAGESKASPKGRGRKRAGGKLFADDPSGMIYFIGTMREWENDILPVIKKIDDSAKTSKFGGEFIPLAWAEPEATGTTLKAYFKPGKGKTGVAPKFLATPGGLLVGQDLSPAMMDDIRATIAQLDVDPRADKEIEQRAFKLTHADPADVEKAIRELFGGAQSRGKRSGQQKEDEIKIALTAAGLIVIAPKEEMEQIAGIIEQMDQPASIDKVMVKRFELVHADASEIAGQIEPMLQSKLTELSQGGKRGGKAQIKQKLTVQDDPRTNSVFVVAPPMIIDYAVLLIEQLDVPAKEAGETYVDYYECANISADDLAGVLQALFAGGRAPSTKPRDGGSKGRDRSRAKSRSKVATGGEIEIIPLAGDRAVMISAPSQEELQEVLVRAKEIDARATSTDKVLKRFVLQYADVDDVAESIIDMLDKPKAKGRAMAGSEDDDSFWDFEIGTRCGTDICVTPMYEAATILVYCPPEKLPAIEMLIEQFENINDPGQQDTLGATEKFATYVPEFLSPIEVVGFGDTLLAQLYPNGAPFELIDLDSDTVMIKGPPKYWAFVKDLIRKHVDTAKRRDSRGSVIDFVMLPPRGKTTPAQILKLMKPKLPNVEFEIETMGKLQDEGEMLIEEIIIPDRHVPNANEEQ